MLWNQAFMHDGTGQIVNLYEVGIGSDSRPEDINGRRVVEINRKDGDYAGLFKAPVAVFSPSIEISINYNASGSGNRPGRNIDTPMHEMGHLLGLNDLDADLPSTDWPTHRTLMGYSRGTTDLTLSQAITYHDIQGIAVLNNRHTDHHFIRYVQRENDYLHYCFYCDTADCRSSVISGASEMESASNCVHAYQPMVSLGDKHWFKCTKCYNVIESNDFYVQGNAPNALSVTGLIDSRKASIIIPRQIDGINLTEIDENAFSDKTCLANVDFQKLSNINTIGANAFAGCVNLSSINLPASITTIGEGAFKNCQSLTNITIPSSVINIGVGAFSGCNDLNITVSSSNPNYSAVGNILYDKAKTKIISTGKTASELNILDSVTEIGSYAFAENSNLVSVRFSNTPVIGAYAFYHCPNMNSVYFDSYNVPEIGENSFSKNNFVLYTRYNAQSAYQNIFSSYTNNIVSIPLQVMFISDGQVIQTQTVYNGSTINNLPIPTKTGYEFNGWYPDDTYLGEPYQNGDLWESETDLYAYAKWTPKQYIVTLDANGGTLNGSNTFYVTYGNTYSTSAVVNKTGYTFEGWYDSEGVRCMTHAGQGTTLWNKTEDTTLYAHWTVEKYEIQINIDGSIVWLGAKGLSEAYCTIEYGTVLSAINLVPTFKASSHGFKEGMIFDHFEYDDTTVSWTSVPDLGDDGAVITIIPVWILEEYTIYFNTTCEIEVSEIVKEFDQQIDLPEVNRTGYMLAGWYTSLSGDVPVIWQTMPDLTPTTQSNGSIMLYAKWEPITYTVVYDKNGGAGTMASSSHTYNEPKNLSWNLYSKTGCDFKGWATTSTGSVVYSDGQSVENLTEKNLSAVTLYAIWQPKTYNIIYKNLMSGMEVYPKTYTYGVGLTSMPIIFVKTGSGVYKTELEDFYGWYTNSSFTSRVYSISKTQMGDITVYAKYDLYLGGEHFSGTQTVTDGFLDNQPSFNVPILLKKNFYDEIKDTTLKKIKIELSMNIWEESDGYQDLYLFNGDTQIWKQTIEHGAGYKETTPSEYTFVIELNIADYRTVDWMQLTFGAHGAFGDTWKFSDFKMSVYFTN